MNTPPSRCTVCQSQPPGFTCGLNPRVQAAVGTATVTQAYRRGQTVFLAGTPASALYVVHSGQVKIFRGGPGGEVQVLRVLGPGEILGYRPLLANELYASSGEAVEDSALCVIPAAIVRDLLRDIPEFAIELLAKLARELRVSEDLMMGLLHHPVRRRAARVLLALLEDNRHASDPMILRTRHLRRQDMARMIGTTPETFSRVLRDFCQRGMVSLSRDHIRVRDMDLLKKAAG